MRRRLLAVSIGTGVGAILLTVLLVVAGGGDSDGPTTTTTAPITEPVAGGILRLGVERLASLDPAEADRGVQSQAMVADLLFDGLTELRPDGAVVPALAERWEDEGLKVWRFTLAEGRTFHDGSPVTADDVVFTLQRLAARGPSSSASVQLELVEGYRAFAVDGTAETLQGLSAPDPRTIEVRLVEPLATFPDLLAAPAFGIVPKAAAAGPTDPPFAEQPVGSGPFAVASRDADAVRLQRVEGRAAFLDAVHVLFYDDATAAYDALGGGEVDVVRVPGDRVADATRRFGDGVSAPYVAELYYGFNLSQAPLGDARLREAIVAAIDRDALVDDVYQGTAAPLDGLVPPGAAGHQDGACPKCRHDVARARTLVAEAFPDGNVPEVFIDYDEGSPQDLIAAGIHEALRSVGIPATMRPHRFDPNGSAPADTTTTTGEEGAQSYQDFLGSDAQHVFRLGWIGAAANADAFLTPVFRTNAPDNVVGYSKPEVDALLTDARATADPAERVRKYQEAERMILDEMVVLPLAQFRTWLVARPAVRDLSLTMFGTFDAGAVWLVPENGAPAGEPG